MLCMGCMEVFMDGIMVCPHCGYVVGTGPEEAYYLKPETILQGKYIVGRVLGYGGFGITYLGYDLQLNRKIAIKEYLPSDFSTRSIDQNKVTIFPGEAGEQFQRGLESFIQEARKLAKFHSVPTIVDIYDCFIENDTGYIVMEYLEGKNIKQIIKEQKKLDYPLAESVIKNVLEGLAVVHKEGIIHRDIAPDNIFILDNGEIRLIDFGASRYATTEYSKSISVILKPGYAPEEQYRSRGEQGSFTDIYAVAATFYRMITGKRPQESVERMIEDHLEPPSKLGVSIPASKENAIMNALNVRQEDRIKTAEEFLKELDSEKTKRVLPSAKKDPFKIPIWLKGMAGGVAVLAFVTAGLLFSGVLGGEDEVVSTEIASLAEGMINVPQFSTLSYDEAKKLAEDNGLLVQLSDEQYSTVVEKDRIIRQEPAYGTVVSQGSKVSLVISGGTERLMVPDVFEYSKENAEKILEESSLVVAYAEPEINEEIPENGVVLQNPGAGESVAAGSVVTLTLSLGTAEEVEKRKVSLMDVTGMSYKKAKQKLGESNIFNIFKEEEYSDTVKKGNVISQSREAGERILNTEEITLVVSKGVEQVIVPNVHLKTEKKAKKLLKKAGLTVEIQKQSSNDVEKGKVILQSIETGEMVDKNTEVVIYVSTGKAQSSPASSGGGNTNTGGNSTPAGQTPQPAPNPPAAPPVTPQPQPEPAPTPAQDQPASGGGDFGGQSSSGGGDFGG